MRKGGVQRHQGMARPDPKIRAGIRALGHNLGEPAFHPVVETMQGGSCRVHSDIVLDRLLRLAVCDIADGRRDDRQVPSDRMQLSRCAR